jgi:general stress protein YciG
MDEIPVVEKRLRGFARLTAEQRRVVAAIGGRAAHARKRAHRFTAEEARAAGRKGGLASSRNKEHMREIGRRGGLAVSADPGHMKELSRRAHGGGDGDEA